MNYEPAIAGCLRSINQRRTCICF